MVNDVSMAIGIIIIFIALGAVMPYIYEANGSTYTGNTAGTLGEDVASGATSATKIGLGSSLISIGKMFIWSFGAIPIWFEIIIFLPMRIMLIIIIIRNFPVIGAGGS